MNESVLQTVCVSERERSRGGEGRRGGGKGRERYFIYCDGHLELYLAMSNK